MKKVVIVGASRTPMGGFHGEMSQATAPELGGAAIKGAIEGAGVKNENIDEVIVDASAAKGHTQPILVLSKGDSKSKSNKTTAA